MSNDERSDPLAARRPGWVGAAGPAGRPAAASGSGAQSSSRASHWREADGAHREGAASIASNTTPFTANLAGLARVRGAGGEQ